MKQIAELKSKVKQPRLEEKLGEQSFYHDTKEPPEPITSIVRKTSG